MKKFITAAVVIVLLLVVGGLNNQLNNNTVHDRSDDEEEHSAKQVPNTPAAPKPAAPAVYQANTKATAPVSEAVIGAATAPTTVTVGYSWDPALQQNQDAVKKIITDVEAWGSQPGHHAQIVCVDIPSDQRRYPENGAVGLGIAINGKPAAGLSGNPGTDIKPQAVSALLATLK